MVESTGERLVPDLQRGELIYAEHLARYFLASQLAAGRRVLDAGCGEGYGTAILAAAGAASVVGVDVDEPTLTGSSPTFIVDLGPGQEACLANVIVPRDTTGVRLFVGTHDRPGPNLTLFLRDRDQRVVRRGELQGGYGDAQWQVVPFDPVERVGRDYALCFMRLARSHWLEVAIRISIRS